MNPRSLLTGLSTLLVSGALLTSTHGSAAADPDYIQGVKVPDPRAPLASWTAAQQYMPDYGVEDSCASDADCPAGELCVAGECEHGAEDPEPNEGEGGGGEGGEGAG